MAWAGGPTGCSTRGSGLATSVTAMAAPRFPMAQKRKGSTNRTSWSAAKGRTWSPSGPVRSERRWTEPWRERRRLPTSPGRRRRSLCPGKDFVLFLCCLFPSVLLVQVKSQQVSILSFFLWGMRPYMSKNLFAKMTMFEMGGARLE